MDQFQRSLKIQTVEEIIDYSFNDNDIIWEALQAPGSIVTLIGTRRVPDGNKRLAILGDTILQLALIEDAYERGETRGISSHQQYE